MKNAINAVTPREFAEMLNAAESYSVFFHSGDITIYGKRSRKDFHAKLTASDFSKLRGLSIYKNLQARLISGDASNIDRYLAACEKARGKPEHITIH